MSGRRSPSQATEALRHPPPPRLRRTGLVAGLGAKAAGEGGCLRASVARWGEQRRTWLVAAAFIAWLSPLSAQQLLDRVVARINGAAITLTDVQAAVALGVIDAPPGPDGVAVAIERLIDRQLVLAEVARFAPPEPAPADVVGEMGAMTARAGPRLAAVMASTGLDEARIRDIARDTLRIEAYLNQRFGTTMQLTENEVEQYYRIHPDEFTRNGALMPFAEAEPLARHRAGAERRASTIAQWMRDLRERAEVMQSRR